MALLTVLRITFLANDPYYGSGMVAGDIVETQWETSTQVFTVTKNGVNYPQTGSVRLPVTDDLAAAGFDMSWRTVSILIPATCVGTSLWAFSVRAAYTVGRAQGTSDWPYVQLTEEANSNVCASAPVINDLAWVGIKPYRNNATSSTSADGLITYTATSSNTPVVYALTAGTGKMPVFDNTTGTFTNLTAGSYKIWAKDAAGFMITFSISILDMSAGPTPPPVETPTIYFPGSPTLSQDTGPGDGSITYTALSQNPPIEYALRDFIYGDGLGQASSTFNNLRAGSYTLFAIDSSGARAAASFTIPLNVAPSPTPAGTPNYDIRFQLSSKDLNGKVATVNIVKKNTVGTPTDVDGGSENPIVHTIRLQGNDDKYASIAAATLTLCLKSATVGQFQELFDITSESYRVNFYHDGILKMTGKIYPQSYREPYTESVNYPVTVTATDGLVELDSLDFVDESGAFITGKNSELDIIALILQKLEFNIGIRSAINMYAVGMNVAASDDPLEQAFVDCRAYYNADEPLSCLDVLKRILEPYQATILQWEGFWWIVRFEEFISTSVPYREYDYTGAYRSNGTHNPIVNVKKTSGYDRLHWTGEVFMDMVEPFGNIEVIYKQGKVKSLLRNGEFKINYNTGVDGAKKASCDLSAFSFVQNSDTYFSSNLVKANDSELGEEPSNGALSVTATGKAYIMTKIENFTLGGSDQLNIAIKVKLEGQLVDFPYQKVKIQVQHGTVYLQQDGRWTTTPSTIIHYVKEFGKYVELKTSALASGTFDDTLTVKVYSSFIWDPQFTDYTSMRALATVDLPTGYRTEYSTTTPPTVGNLLFYELENNTSAESVPTIIRPTDYNAVTNPYQWILKTSKESSISLSGNFPTTGTAVFDYIRLDYVPGGAELTEDKIVNLLPKATRQKLTRTIYHGSAPKEVETIFTAIDFLGNLLITPLWFANPNYAHTHINYLRSSAGVPWDKWTRDAVVEEHELQIIVMRAYAAQYRQPSRRLTGSLSNIPIGGTGTPVYLSPASVIKDNYDGRFYRPMGYSWQVRDCVYDGEFLEIKDITAGGTSTTGRISSFTNDFNNDFL